MQPFGLSDNRPVLGIGVQHTLEDRKVGRDSDPPTAVVAEIGSNSAGHFVTLVNGVQLFQHGLVQKQRAATLKARIAFTVHVSIRCRPPAATLVVEQDQVARFHSNEEPFSCTTLQTMHGARTKGPRSVRRHRGHSLFAASCRSRTTRPRRSRAQVFATPQAEHGVFNRLA